MSLQSNNQIVVLTGGTGKVSSRIAPLLSAYGNTTLVASRSGTTPSLPCCQGVKFDWLDSTSYTAPFEHGPVSAIFLVAPPIMECFPPMKTFIDLAIGKGTKRFVLLSASVLDSGDGPIKAQVANYIISLNVEYAILRPTWFMENFSEMQHASTIRDQDTIITATGEGKLPFVSVHDIAAVAFRALTDRVPHNVDHDILGPELFSYDDVACRLTQILGHQITHVNITEDELAAGMSAFMPKEYASMLAQLDTAVKNGVEDRLNNVVEKVTGKKPRRFEDYLNECLQIGVWMKK